MALTIKTSRSGATLPATLAMPMLVWSLTAPIAFLMVLGAMNGGRSEKMRIRSEKKNGDKRRRT